MSNVNQRNHTPTGLEYLELSRELRKRVHVFCDSPKRYPKSCTFTLKIPTINLVREINDNAVVISCTNNASVEKCQKKHDLAEDILSKIAVLDEEILFAVNLNGIKLSEAEAILDTMSRLKSKIIGVREAASKRISELNKSQKKE